ncbi:SDR family NAD(P)-dependent oxidoreductase [Aeromicrobium phragmitis]|uniref:SDR family NAD(P)-dependent oxidoreductase n=1 Tax=Aeromicrobium phragmitis TaxID=2478914 RepID=A0A3L8PT02_9ACTN|nr:oxidoreductase [Aeromicrobium phragmitis]RLV57558.1 SDR family NAD(P)-dependent oxidoreductase [Aeromicrobium phragmitis]
MSDTWTTEDIGDLRGRTAVITGVTGGLGAATALGLARRGAGLIVTARDLTKAQDAVDRLRREAPDAQIEVVRLDLADLTQTTAAATELAGSVERVDILVNNAGIMIPPFSRTKDGFELQMGTNHLGHFAWTAGLWPALRHGARVVTVSSLAHASARRLDLRVLTAGSSPPRYRRWQAYGESKLANLLFALELDRRTKAAGLAVTSVAAHPGYASTNLTKTGLTLHGSSLPAIAVHQITGVIGQSASMGALPLLRAATDPALSGGEYLGPGGFQQLRGKHPRRVGMTRLARDEALAASLWEVSERAAGVQFEVS